MLLAMFAAGSTSNDAEKKVNILRFDHLCYGQWTSMVNLSPRLPIKSNAISDSTAAPSTEKQIGVKMNVKVNGTARRDITESNETETMTL